jgi:hypothetical protein
MQNRVVFNVLQTSLRKPDSQQVLMLALALLNALVLMLVLFSKVPGIQVLWFIPSLGILMCLCAVVLSPFTKSL